MTVEDAVVFGSLFSHLSMMDQIPSFLSAYQELRQGRCELVKGADVAVLGLTFKENCPDLRNSKVIDVVHELRSYGCRVHVHDPVAQPAEAQHEYGVELTAWEALPRATAVVAAVAHDALVRRTPDELAALLLPGGIVADVKCTTDAAALRARGLSVWRL